jgi:hypothetical protein
VITARVLAVAAPAGLALHLALAVAGARAARAQSFVQQVSDDACEQAQSFAPDDDSPAAAHARRACRLQIFERKLIAERRQALIADQQAQEAWVANWFAATQPQRVQRPFSVEGFFGSGLASYGVVVSWNILSQLEVSARYGQRAMNCSDMYGALNGDCTRTLMGGSGRWMMLPKNFTPFVGAGFSVTKAHLQVLRFDPMTGQTAFAEGNGRAHSVNLSAGAQLSVSALRLSLEYVYEHIYFTGAQNLMMFPSKELLPVWQGSVDADKHGVRFQVGFAF